MREGGREKDEGGGEGDRQRVNGGREEEWVREREG